jgi:hypothetical protein
MRHRWLILFLLHPSQTEATAAPDWETPELGGGRRKGRVQAGL